MAGPKETRLPAGVATERRFIGCDLQLLTLLGRHTDADGWCRRRQTRIAVEMGLTRPTIVRSVARLKAIGWLEVEHQLDARGMNASAAYRIVEPAMAGDLFEHAERAEKPSRRTHARVSAESQDESARTRVASPPIEGMNGPFSERTTTTAQVNDDRHPPVRKQAPPPQPELLLPIGGGEPAVTASEAPPRPADARPMAVPDRMFEKLTAAAGDALRPARLVDTTLLTMTAPLAWLRDGADFEADVLPTVQRLAARKPPGSVQSWDYFAAAVREARDSRLAALSSAIVAHDGRSRPPPHQQRRGRRNGFAALYRKLSGDGA